MAASYDLPADHLLDRRRLRRKLSFWRVMAILALIIAIAVAGFRLAGGAALQGDHIARVTLSGLITGDRQTLALLDRVGRAPGVKAVILSINSPGGTVTGSEQVYEEIRRLSAKKPVVAVVGNLGASGAYVAALGAERIFSSQNSLIGSIGVLMQFPNVAKLLDNIGVKMEAVKSSPLKASPNGMEPTSEEARAAISAIVKDSYDWFKALVRDRRRMDEAELARVTDGRVFTGRQSLQLKLVDELGGESAAVAWLKKEKKIASDVNIRDWRVPAGFGASRLTSLANVLGLESVARLLSHGERVAGAHTLDGLVAIWHGWSAD